MPPTTYVDLSMTIHEQMPTNRPDHFPPRITTYSDLHENGWRGTQLSLDSHCGTHVDAPSHFIDDGSTVDQIPLSALIGSCQVRHLAAPHDRFLIRADHIGPLRAERVLLDTGWSIRLGDDPRGYFTRHAYLSEDAAHHLVDSGVRLLGIDCPSVDLDDGAVHDILLGSGVVIVENLTRLESLPDACELAVLPLRIAHGDGSPARAVAIVRTTAQ